MPRGWPLSDHRQVTQRLKTFLALAALARSFSSQKLRAGEPIVAEQQSLGISIEQNRPPSQPLLVRNGDFSLSPAQIMAIVRVVTIPAPLSVSQLLARCFQSAAHSSIRPGAPR